MHDPIRPIHIHVASLLSDQTANTLFGNQQAPIHRHRMEQKVRQKTSDYLMHLYREQEEGIISLDVAAGKLSVLDEWLHLKLSGENMLALALHIEAHMPDFILYLPKFMGARYEELRVARLWSALLNPEALEHLIQSIRDDSDTVDGNEGGDMFFRGFE